mmetsp:Transcript_105663/g.297220  ORF Transcript_105663/g.297220 Transcript_105663/m.297220 type:complete len:461 (-) Transcript_105663:27-1409(-)
MDQSLLPQDEGTPELSIQRLSRVGASDAFGGKSIGLFGGVMLLANCLAGPTVSLMPGIAQEAGWLAMVLGMVGIAGISAACGVMLLEAMRSIPGNHDFEQRVEVTDLLAFYLSPIWHALALACYIGYTVLMLMSYIIQTAQILDYFFLDVLGCAWGLELSPDLGIVCGNVSGSSTPFGPEAGIVLSGSFAVVALLCTPCALAHLDDNVFFQALATLGFALLALVWLVLLGARPGFPSVSSLPVVTSSQGSLVGTLLFNFAFIGSLPSWANERRPGTSVGLTFFLSMAYVVVVYSLLGVVGALAFEPFYGSDENLFSKLTSSGSWLGRFTVELYPVLQNLTSIPVFCIFMKYNLMQLGWFGLRAAALASVAGPLLLSVPFYTGKGFEEISDVGGMAFSSIVNFVLPCVLYALARARARTNGDMAPETKQGQEQESNGTEGGTPSTCSSEKELDIGGQKWMI